MKLNDKLIKEICEARELKMTIGEICELYNIARSTVYRALKKAKIKEIKFIKSFKKKQK